MEGCSKYCSFCIVPYTRGEEVSRAFDSVLAEVRAARRAGRARGHAARPERQRLRGPMADGARGRSGDAHPPRGARARHRAHPLHHLAPARVQRQPDRGLRQRAAARQPPAPAGAERLRPRARAHEARLHGARVQGQGAPAARGAPRHLDLLGLHRRLSRRDRARLRGDARAGARGRLRPVLQLHLQPPSGDARGLAARTRCAHGGEAAAPRAAAGAARSPGARHQRGDGRHAPARAGRAAGEARHRASSPAAPPTTAGSTSPGRASSSTASPTSRSPRRSPTACAAGWLPSAGGRGAACGAARAARAAVAAERRGRRSAATAAGIRARPRRQRAPGEPVRAAR